jgi:hypothetical protein
MVNSITRQTILDGSKWLIVKIHIEGDGSGEETATVLVDASTYNPAFVNESLEILHANLSGFTMDLLWDATANVPITNVPDYEVHITPDELGVGLPNNAGAGKTGDILFTTIGLGANDHGTITLKIKKKPA